MKRPIKILLFVVVLMQVTLACGTNHNVEDVQEAQPTDNPEPLGSSLSNPAPVGSKVTADDIEFEILGITRPATYIVKAANMFNTQPGVGQEYIFVELQATCTKSSDKECSISTFKAKLVGSSGIERESEWFVSGVDGLFEDTQFYGGETINGQIPFIIDSDETDLVFIYQPQAGEPFYLAIP